MIESGEMGIGRFQTDYCSLEIPLHSNLWEIGNKRNEPMIQSFLEGSYQPE